MRKIKQLLKHYRIVNFLLIGIIALLLSTISCNKDNEESSNKAPICLIISPNNGEEITKGTFVNISVDAEDSDGSINKVRYYIDEIGVGSSDSFPYNFAWETKEESLGNHTIKATAIDNESDSASNEIIISIVINVGPCPGMPTVTDIDGNTYNTVQIGDQCWMQENLKTTSYNNGTSIPNITDNIDWLSLTTGAYVWYNNDISWKGSYGALYNWYATVDTKGLCPTGWHIPTDDEWTILTDYIGGIDFPHGNELKSCRQINSPDSGECNTTEHPRWEENFNYGTDNYGFSGLPGGIRNIGAGNFSDIGETGFWWSSTENTSYYGWIRALDYSIGFVVLGGNGKAYGNSVRCLRD